MSEFLTGWLEFRNRSQEQNDYHEATIKKLQRSLPQAPSLAKGDKIALYDYWSKPEVVEDVGFVFPRFHQLTGSCVGAGGGNALFSLIAVQRCLADNPTKAFIPWWPYNYGKGRYHEGDRGRGEGSTGSAEAWALMQGVFDAFTDGLTKFDNSDGMMLTEEVEMAWSDGGSSIVTKWDDTAKKHPLGSAAEVKDVAGAKASLINGYPLTCACDDYIGNGHIKGEGENAYVTGSFDGRGGHQTSIHAVWEHPNDGPLYLYVNNWPGNTYPKDPSGAPLCCVWITEAELEKVWSRLGGEVYALSHLAWFPAQPKVLNTLI